jgi:hypothetical protein
MKIEEIVTSCTRNFWERSLQGNGHIYFSAQLRCSLLNRMTIPLRRALPDRKINVPLALSNYGS